MGLNSAGVAGPQCCGSASKAHPKGILTNRPVAGATAEPLVCGDLRIDLLITALCSGIQFNFASRSPTVRDPFGLVVFPVSRGRKSIFTAFFFFLAFAFDLGAALSSRAADFFFVVGLV